MLAEKKSAAWTATTNITSKSVFGFLSATSLELQMLEVCKAMGCSFEQDDSIRPKQYIGELRKPLLFPLSFFITLFQSTCSTSACKTATSPSPPS